jgi:hypothetical protein
MSVSRSSNHYHPLTHEESKHIKHLESLIESADKSKLTEALTVLAKSSPMEIYRLTKSSPRLDLFCQSNTRLHNAWAKFLKAKNYVSTTVISMDYKETHDVYDLYRGVALYSAFKKSRRGEPHRLEAIDKACELGSFDGIVTRCEINLKAAMSSKQSDKSEEAIENLLRDIDRLTNLYWGAGYAKAAFLLLDLTAFFASKYKANKNSDQTEMVDQSLNNAKSFRENTIKNFICAAKLEDNTYSNLLLASITQGEGVVYSSGKNKFNSWFEAKEYFYNLLKDQYVVVENQAVQELSSREDAFTKNIEEAEEHAGVEEMKALTSTTSALNLRFAKLLNAIGSQSQPTLVAKAESVTASQKSSTASSGASAVFFKSESTRDNKESVKKEHDSDAKARLEIKNSK